LNEPEKKMKAAAACWEAKIPVGFREKIGLPGSGLINERKNNVS